MSHPFLKTGEVPPKRKALSDKMNEKKEEPTQKRNVSPRTKKAKVPKTFHLEPHLVEYIEELFHGDKKISSMNQVLNLLLENCYDRKVKI